MGYAIQLQAVDRVTLAARKRSVLRFEFGIERVGGDDRLVEQVPLPGGLEVGDGDLKTAVAALRLRAECGNSLFDTRVEVWVRMRLQGHDRRFEDVTVQPAPVP